MKSLESYGEARIRAIHKALEKYHEFRETDSLHRIRVEMKKLKATLHVAEYADPKFKAHKAYLPLRKIFRRAGLIRQPAVMLEMLAAQGMEYVPPRQVEILEQECDKFRADTPFFMTEVNAFGKRLRRRWRKISRKEISGYIKLMQHYIERTFVPRMKRARLHKARKRIKEIMYLSRLANRLSPRDTRFYGSMESAIGSLHDKQVLLKFLASVPGKETFPSESIRREALDERYAIKRTARKFYRH